MKFIGYFNIQTGMDFFRIVLYNKFGLYGKKSY